MLHLHRRSLFRLAAASALPLRARKLQLLGVQLYTLRGILSRSPLEVLREVEHIGYREVELTADNLEKIYAAVRQTSLRPVSLHLDSALFTRRPDGLPAALEDARKRELAYVVCPYVAPQDRGGPDVMRRLGDTLNKAGEIAGKLGMRLCYHNHAFDFAPGPDGKTLLDVLLETSDPKLVGLELDIMWSQVAGVPPAGVLRKYGSRVELLHLKNVAEGIEKRYDENVPRTAFREVGDGVIDIPAVLQAAAGAGVRHYFVEQDQTSGDPLAALRGSYEYVAKLDF